MFDLWVFGVFFTILLFISDMNGIHKSKRSATYIHISFFLRKQQHKERLDFELARMRAVSALLRSQAELSLIITLMHG
jgi:hypothetical protein